MKLLNHTEYWAKCYICGAQSDPKLTYLWAEHTAQKQGFTTVVYRGDGDEITVCPGCAKQLAEQAAL